MLDERNFCFSLETDVVESETVNMEVLYSNPSSSMRVKESDHSMFWLNHVAQTSYRKSRVAWVLTLEDHTLAENTFLGIKHSHSVWVTDTASLHSG